MQAKEEYVVVCLAKCQFVLLTDVFNIEVPAGVPPSKALNQMTSANIHLWRLITSFLFML